MREKENQEREERGREKIILGVYSIYTIAMMCVTFLLKWNLWIVPLIFLGMLISWGFFIRKYKDYRFRAFFTASMALLNFLIYGIKAESFFSIISTMGALVILLGIYNIPEIIYLAAGGSIFLLFFHGAVLQSIDWPASAAEGARRSLQLLSIFTIEFVTYYLVKTHIEMNQKLREMIEDLKRVEQSKDDFMANVSHEIRTPINTVCGISEMILMEEISDVVRDDVRDIQIAGRNLLRIVSDILDFTELQSGELELVEEPYNMTSTVNDIINMSVAQIGDKKIELIVDCDANIPKSLLGDEQKIRRVIMNLMNNAVKFTQEGCIRIAIGARREEYGVNLCVNMRDTGIGIKEEYVEKLFSSFNQVDTRKNRQEGGLGLGLAISQAIIEKMGGFITVNSVFGKGTEIQFVIPQKVLEDQPIIVVQKPEKKRVLSYIDMEKYKYSLIREGYSNSIFHMTEQLGINYHQCRNIGEIKRKLDKEKFTHVFIGWEEYCQDKEFFERIARELPVIMVTDKRREPKEDSHIYQIYKPFSVLSIAAVLNGNESVTIRKNGIAVGLRFTAPQACILVVDDNLMNLKVVEGLLRPYEIRVFTANSGKEALEKVEQREFDFIFMDHMMPEMDGVETLHRIRQKPGAYFQNIPIIALTANAIGGAREMFLSEGFQDFVSKPIELSILERVLKKYIPEHKILKVETVQQKESRQQEKIGQETLKLEGIDVEKGIGYCGGRLEDYCEIAGIYAVSGAAKIEEIEKFYQQKDWKNYTILVHAVKSTSLGIGAEHLSLLAKELEQAGKEGQERFIEEHHQEMLREYQQVLAVLNGEPRILEKAGKQEEADARMEDGEIQEIAKEELLTLLQELKERMQSYEGSSVMPLLEELAGYKYGNLGLQQQTQGMKKKVEDFDFMGAEELCTALLEKVR